MTRVTLTVLSMRSDSLAVLHAVGGGPARLPIPRLAPATRDGAAQVDQVHMVLLVRAQGHECRREDTGGCRKERSRVCSNGRMQVCASAERWGKITGVGKTGIRPLSLLGVSPHGGGRGNGLGGGSPEARRWRRRCSRFPVCWKKRSRILEISIPDECFPQEIIFVLLGVGHLEIQARKRKSGKRMEEGSMEESIETNKKGREGVHRRREVGLLWGEWGWKAFEP
jgi:hypothetical protein